MSDPTEIPAPSLPDRYGTGRASRRGPVVALAVVVVGALVGWALWAAWLSSDRAIEATLTHYDVVSTHEIRVKVSAHFRDADVDGSCLLRATAEDHTIVGEVNLTADELREAQGSWIPIRTERRATTAAVIRCTD